MIDKLPDSDPITSPRKPPMPREPTTNRLAETRRLRVINAAAAESPDKTSVRYSTSGDCTLIPCALAAESPTADQNGRFLVAMAPTELVRAD
jgi:hypothetical protein